MTIKSALEAASIKLDKKRISSARLDAEVLMSFVLNKPRVWLLAYSEKTLKPAEQKLYSTLISRRARYEPVAYLVGSKEFYGLPIKVNGNALIPRPETEQLVDEAIAYFKGSRGSKTPILDVGTGSGSIALALAKSLPQATIAALDASPDALNLAKNNAKALKLPISFIKSDLLANVKKELINGSIIVANLPYLDKAELKKFPIEIKHGLAYEPQSALYAGKRGTALYEKLFKQILNLNITPKIIIAEIGSSNWRDFLRLAKADFSAAKISIKKDLARRPRILVIEF